MSESTVGIIRKDAQVQITLGTNIIKQLQELSLFILASQPETDIDNFQKELSDNVQTFEEPWKTHYMSIATLLYYVDEAAKEQGFVDQVPESQASSQLNN